MPLEGSETQTNGALIGHYEIPMLEGNSVFLRSSGGLIALPPLGCLKLLKSGKCFALPFVLVRPDLAGRADPPQRTTRPR